MYGQDRHERQEFVLKDYGDSIVELGLVAGFGMTDGRLWKKPRSFLINMANI